MNNWFVYILLCVGDKLYTGIAKDPQQRLVAHKNKHGAKYTRINKPLKIVYLEQCIDRSMATKREIEIKKLTKINKLKLIKTNFLNSRLSSKIKVNKQD